MPRNDADRYASLFVAVTGRETVTERRTDVRARGVRPADRDVEAAVADAVRETGLDDAIGTPERTPGR